VQASEPELRQVAASGEDWVDVLVGARQLVHDGMRESLLRTRIGENREALFRYLLMTMRNLTEERVFAMFADRDGFIISEEVIAQGDHTKALLSPRRIFGRAFQLDARRILLAHNHPSGCPCPSLSDIEHTRRLSLQAAALDLHIDDHLVIGAREVTSMKDRGLF
jgi:DNA repair protein RadC